MRLALPAVLLSTLAIVLACSGSATSSEAPAADPVPDPGHVSAITQADPVPFRMVGSTAWAWPPDDLTDSAVLAADSDPATSWTPADGETAVFFVAGTPTSVRVQGQASSGRMRLWLKGKKRWEPEVGDWVDLASDGDSLTAPTMASARILGIEVDADGPVHTVQAIGTPGPTTTEVWELSLTAATDHTFVDWHEAPIGTIDLDACSVRKPMAGPGEVFEGACTAGSDALTLKGTIGGYGPMDATLPIVDMGPCLKLVGGWPFTRCQ